MNRRDFMGTLAAGAAGAAFGGIPPGPERQRPLSEYKVYRGNSHSHTIFTWTHGSHRSKGVDRLDAPTKFHPEWTVPPGMDWRDPRTTSLNPADYTNRQGLPANHFKLASENGYDFYVVTDHSQEPTLQPVSARNTAWGETLKAADHFTKAGSFVALAGFEYSRNTAAGGGEGHINAMNVADYVSADHGQRGPAPAWPEANWTIPKFYGWLKTAKPHGGQGCVVASFNHPGTDQYNDWDHIDGEIADAISLFELHSNYKRSRLDAYIRALNKGWKVSPIGVHDNHNIGDISNAALPPPTCVLAPELTKAAITQALRQRRTFASWNPGVELRYAVNGFVMGSTLDSPETFNFQIEVKTRPGEAKERVRRIQILRDDPGGADKLVVATEMRFDGDRDEVVWAPVVKDASARYFLLRVHHANDLAENGDFKPNGSTLSAPVWTGRPLRNRFG